MAIKKATTICVTSVKGGVGKTIMTLNFAGVLANLDKHVLIIDFDLSDSAIAFSLAIQPENDSYRMARDIKNNQYSTFEEYVFNYNDHIDVLPAPLDPRDANKMSPKYVEMILDKAKTRYDVILIDTNHVLSDINLVTYDAADTILYLLPKDLLALKNMRSMVTIYEDMEKNNYKVVLYNSKPESSRFSTYDVNHMIDKKIDYEVDSLYAKNIDSYLLSGKIMTLDKKYQATHKKGIKQLEKIMLDILR